MIPVFEPQVGESEITAVTDAIRRGEISGSFGETIPKFEQEFAEYCGVKYGIAVSSGSTALQLAVRAMGLGQGDEILVSASTNIASALAAFHNGAVPVPVDSEPVTWNLDLSLIESLVTPRTKAILPVHLFGHPVDMDALLKISRKLNLRVIEDCAEAHGATVRGRKVGSFGDFGCFSFYANKIITTGEGGMLVTNDPELADKARLLRNLAFTTPRFKHWVAGFNFRMTGFQAAMGRAQLSRIESIIAGKRRLADSYRRHLSGVPGLRLPVEQAWAKHVYWMYGILLEPGFGISRDELASRLKAEDVETRTFFCSMSAQPCLESQPGYRPVACGVADSLWERGMYLPSSPSLKDAQIEGICDVIRRARVERKAA